MKKQRFIPIALAVMFLVFAGVYYFVRTPRLVATSPDGQIHFVALKYYRGTNISTAFGSKPEAWVRDVLGNIGFLKVQRTSLNMISPPNTHLFILEYTGNIGDVRPNYIEAEVVQPDGTYYRLNPTGGGMFGIQRRRFAFWTLNGVPHLDPQQTRIKIYLPKDAPTLLPLPK